jgi:hypothetical protein
MNNFEYKPYYSMNVYIIYDNDISNYMSNTCNLKYIIELGLIKKEDILDNYNSIFNIDNIHKNIIREKIYKFKELFDNNNQEKKTEYNFKECYGC